MYSPLTRSECIIRFSPVQLLTLLAPLAVLFCLSLVVNPESWREAPTQTYVVFGGFGALIVLACVAGPRFNYLRLTPDGLAMHYPGRVRVFGWNEIGGFRVVRGPRARGMPTGSRVVFDLAEDSAKLTAVVRAVAAVNGYGVSIMSWYAIKADDLVGMLEEWKRRYGEDEAACR